MQYRMQNNCAHPQRKCIKSLFYYAILLWSAWCRKFKVNFLEAFRAISSRVLCSPVLSQQSFLPFFFIIFILFKKGVYFEDKFYFPFVLKCHFSFVFGSCMMIELLEPIQLGYFCELRSRQIILPDLRLRSFTTSVGYSCMTLFADHSSKSLASL